MALTVCRPRRFPAPSALRRLRLFPAALLLCALPHSVLSAQSFPRPRPDYLPVAAQSQSATFANQNVGSTSASTSVSFRIFAGVTVTSIQVVDEGQTGLEFNAVSPDTNPNACTATTYATTTTCVVDVTFTPSAPGQRYGAVIVTDNGGLSGVTYLSGTGLAPQAFLGYNRYGAALAQYQQSLNGIPKIGGTGVAVADAQGNIYFGDTSSQILYKLTRTGPETYTGAAIALSGVPLPAGSLNVLAIDGAGNLYTSDSTNIYEISNGVVSKVSLGGLTLNYARSVATDSAGNLYIADSSRGDILVVPPPFHGSPSVLAGFPSSDLPTAVAVDASGTVYYFDQTSRAFKKIENGVASTVAGYGNNANVYDIQIDANNNLLFGDEYNGGVYSLNPSTGKLNTLPVTAQCGITSFIRTAQGDFVSSSIACGDIVEYQASASSALNFATTNVGKTSIDSPQGVTLYNMGNAALTLAVPSTGSNPSVTSSFAVDSMTTCPQVSAGGSPGTIAAGSSCVLAVDFVPAVGGAITGTLTVTGNSMNGTGVTQTIALSGQGIQPIPTVTLSASPTTVMTGAAVALQATVTGSIGTPTGNVTFFDGTAALGTAALSSGKASMNTTFTTVGTHTITVHYAGDSSYIAGTSSAVPVQVEDFGFGLPNSTSTTMLPGQTASFTFNVNPLGGPMLAQDVMLSLSGVPQGVTAQLTPTSVSAGSGATSVQLQLTTSKSGLISQSDRDPLRKAGRISLGLLLLPLFGLRKLRKRTGRWLTIAVLLAASFAGSVALSGCGTASGYFGQKSVSAVITLTGTSGATTHTTSFTLNVE